MAEKTLSIRYVGDDSSLRKTLASIESSHSSVGSKIRSIGSGIVKAGKFAAVGLTGLGVAAGYAFGEFEAAEKVGAQTVAVIESTGGAANVTAKQVGTLATSISRKTGIDDEAIASGQNLLLTFTNVRNEVGRGNDVFTQATRVATDMSTALGQDMKSSAIQLGKALNDPVKGITALQRVGVSFTDQQKAQITAMVEAGNTMGAQKLILAELTKEFGGSAQAQATSSGKMKVALGNLAETVGGVVAPVITFLADKLGAVAGWLSERLPGAIEVVKGGLASLWEAIRPAVEAILPGLIAAFQAVGDWFSTNGGAILAGAKSLWDSLSDALAAAWKVIAKNLWPALQDLFAALAPIIKVVGVVIAVVVKLTLEAIPPLLAALGFVIDILAAVFRAVGRVIDAFGTVAGVVRDAMVSAWNFVRDRLVQIRDLWSEIWGGLKAFLTGVWSGIVGTIRTGVNTITGIINVVIDAINALIRGYNAIPFLGNIGEIPNIPALARGTRSFRGGLALVGERGPELVSLPRGSSVTPAAATSRGMGAAGGLTVVFNGPIIGSVPDAVIDQIHEGLLRKQRRGIGLGLS